MTAELVQAPGTLNVSDFYSQTPYLHIPSIFTWAPSPLSFLPIKSLTRPTIPPVATGTNSNVRLLNCLVYPDDAQASDYRLLVD